MRSGGFPGGVFCCEPVSGWLVSGVVGDFRDFSGTYPGGCSPMIKTITKTKTRASIGKSIVTLIGTVRKIGRRAFFDPYSRFLAMQDDLFDVVDVLVGFRGTCVPLPMLLEGNGEQGGEFIGTRLYPALNEKPAAFFGEDVNGFVELFFVCNFGFLHFREGLGTLFCVIGAG